MERSSAETRGAESVMAAASGAASRASASATGDSSSSSITKDSKEAQRGLLLSYAKANKTATAAYRFLQEAFG